MSEPQEQRPPVLDYQRPMGKPAGSRRRVYVGALAIVGLFFVAIVMLLPTRGTPTERAQRVKCASNLRQIAQAIALYASDNAGAFPPTLIPLVADYEILPEVLACPSSDDTKALGPTTQAVVANLGQPGHISYIYLGAGMNVSTVTSETVIAHDRLENHDNDGVNVLYGDGHVYWHSRAEADYILNELKAGHNPPRPQPGTTTRSAR